MLNLSLLYFFYFSLFGVLFPYLGRFLKHHGYGFETIGFVMAVLTGVNIFAPFLVARISDITGNRLALTRNICFLLLLSTALLYPAWGLWYTVFIVGAIGMSLSMMLPQLEAFSLAFLGNDQHKYGSIRMWGSFGFVITVWLFGWSMNWLSIDWFRYFQVIIVLCLLVTILFLLWREPAESTQTVTEVASSSGLERLKIPAVAIMFLVMLLNQAALAPYNTIGDLYFQQAGFSTGEIGFLLAVAPTSEVILLALMPLLLSRFGYFSLLVLSLVLGVVRWWFTAHLGDQLVWVTVLQLTHSFTFGAMHVLAIYLVGKLFPPNQQGIGQSLYVSLVSGAGLVIGNLVAGQFWQNGTGAQQVFLAGMVICLISVVLTCWFVRPSQVKAAQAAGSVSTAKSD